MPDTKDDFMEELLRDAEINTPDEDGIKKLSKMVKELQAHREEKSALENALSEIDKQIRALEEQEIPEKMLELGVSGFKLDTGESVEMKDNIRASIPEKYKDEAFAWLEKEGHGDLIKSEIKCSLDRGDVEKANLILDILKQQGIEDAELKKAVHWGTLSSFVKEQLGQGAAIPLEHLGVYQGKKVIIKK
jgi:hypothetical protein